MRVLLASMRPGLQRFYLLTALAVAGICLYPSCAWRKQKRPDAALAPGGPRRVGTIAAVNEECHFVLVDVGTLYIPAPGTALKSFSGGAETGILAVNPERKRPFIVADIVKGQPKVGDEVDE